MSTLAGLEWTGLQVSATILQHLESGCLLNSVCPYHKGQAMVTGACNETCHFKAGLLNNMPAARY